jgi:hypothetical protein
MKREVREKEEERKVIQKLEEEKNIEEMNWKRKMN